MQSSSSMAPGVFMGSPELLMPIKAAGHAGGWLQHAQAARPFMARHNTQHILLDNGKDGMGGSTELWPVVSTATAVSEGYYTDAGLLHSEEQQQHQQQHQQQLYFTHNGAPVYAVPQYAAHRPVLYQQQQPGQYAAQYAGQQPAGLHHAGVAAAGRPMPGYPQGTYRAVPAPAGWGLAPSVAKFGRPASQLRQSAAFAGAAKGMGHPGPAYVTYPPSAVTPTDAGSWMSPPDALLTMFKGNPTGVKLSLEEIIGHVVAFCKDQDGSKLLQKLLKPLIVQDTSSVSLQLVIAEMEPHALKLMKHIYGRFVFIAFLGTWGSKYRSMVVDWMHGHFHELATDRYGYAVVKEAIKNCDAQLRLRIAKELHPHVAQVAEDAFGHDAVCVLTESIPTADLDETINALVETLNFQNQYSCSVAMALLDAMAYSDPRRASIITKMRLNAHILAKSSRGILMLERLLDIGTAQEATDVAVMLVPNLVVEELTEHSCAVLLKSLERGGAIAHSLFVAVVLQGGQLNIITHLMNQEYGKEVLQEVLQVLTGLERDALTSQIEKVSQMY